VIGIVASQNKLSRSLGATQRKKIMKKTIYLCFMIILIILTSCEQKGTEGLKYDLISQNSAYEVSKGTAPANKPIIIPAKYNKLPVTKIADNGFADYTMMTTLNIPNTITEIGNNAFAGCSSLNKIDIPNSVTTIKGYAFTGCDKLTSINIPTSMTVIGENAFAGMAGITDVKMHNGVTEIGKRAFYECSSLINIDIPSSLTNIGNFAFEGCIAYQKEHYLYYIGGLGPSGGRIFYKNNSATTKKYLEAAPSGNEFTSDWHNASKRCSNLNINGITGWYLPSKDELNLMYVNLKKQGLGNFGNNWYWSSSQDHNDFVSGQYFGDGKQSDLHGKNYDGRVRACRAF
jgi:hypothetical protein